MSTCPSTEQFRQLLAEQLPGAERDAIESHVEGCASCQELLEELARTTAFKKEWTDAEVPHGSRHDTISTVLRRLKQLMPDAPAPHGWENAEETLPSRGKGSAQTVAGNLPRVPGYEVLEVLGRGGMGIVYKARHLALNRPIALKMIQAADLDNPAALARFRTEAEAIARLQHSQVVQIYEVGEHDGLPYLALELIEGGSLAQRLNGTPLPARQAGRLVEALARAVHAAHQRGLVHRDLKPANILLTPDGTPKVSDFGLAKLMDGGAGPTATGEVLGTPSYMAPEQAESKGLAVGPATDIHAVGAILYEMLTGRPPFRMTTPMETLMQVVRQEPVPPRRLQPATPRDLEIICLKCLQKDPRKRYASAKDLADDLSRFVQSEPIRARPISTWERAWKWAKRQPGWAALAVVSSLAILSLLAGGLWYGAQLRTAVEKSNESARAAEERRLEALRNAQKARDAVDHMLTEVAEKHLVQIPQTETMRLALLNKALEFYREFAKEPEAGWDIRVEKARAFHRVGDIYRYLERYPDAETAYQQAIESFLQLKGEKPDDVNVVQHLAQSYNNLGILYRAMRRPEQAEKAHRNALDIRLQLDRDHPEQIRHQANLAQSYYNLAGLCRSAKRFEEAEKYYRKNLELNEKLIVANPKDPDHRYDLARVYESMGGLYLDQNHPEDKERVLVKAIDILEEVLGEHRSVTKYQYLMSSCQMGLGNVYLARWRKVKDQLARRRWAEQTEVSYRKAIQYAESLVEDQPFNPDYQMQLIASSYNLGLFYRESRRGKEAEALYEKVLLAHKVLALEYPNKSSYAAGLGISYSNLGNCITANGRPEAALALYAEGVRGLEQALVKDKTNSYLRKCLRDALVGWANALTRLARHHEALRCWDRALKLEDARGQENLHLARAATLARRGDHRGAVAEAKTVEQKQAGLVPRYCTSPPVRWMTCSPDSHGHLGPVAFGICHSSRENLR
jgi:tetratricopeptide (TPR) repeat protein/tRNA A-37 threonylcarbamoyl transferase component Bud32